MGLIELFSLAVGLSMDAFAVAVCIGLTMPKVTVKKALIVGLYFGIFQAAMPLIGYLAATLFAGMVTAYAHWIAFILLGILGVKMITGSFKKEELFESEASKEVNLNPAYMLPLAVATSIDALAVGVSFAILKTAIIPAIIIIGLSTLVISMAGVKIGCLFGIRFKSRAELLGGVILLLLGIRILLDGLGIF